MMCNNCNHQNEVNASFCENCGNKLNIQTDCDNPNEKIELAVFVINIVLAIALCIGLSIILVRVFQSIIILFTYFLVAVMTLFLYVPHYGDASNLLNPDLMMYLSIVSVVAIIAFFLDVIAFIQMRKNNKATNYRGKYEVKKIKYLLLTYLVGFLGIHRFAIGDKKTGKKYLALTIGGTILVLILGFVHNNFFLGILLPFFIAEGFSISEFMIALSKPRDTNGKITVN